MGKAVSNGPKLTETAECVSQLVKFFPGAVPVGIPVLICKGGSNDGRSDEQTMIDFGTAEEVLFVSALPLDFEDIVRLRTADGTLDITAKIVAMRFHDDQMAIAARLMEGVANWIIKA